jgi:hypothetical protein
LLSAPDTGRVSGAVTALRKVRYFLTVVAEATSAASRASVQTPGAIAPAVWPIFGRAESAGREIASGRCAAPLTLG